MNDKIISIIGKAGGIGLAALLAYFFWSAYSLQNKVLTNDISHIGEYMQSQTEALGLVRETMVEIKGVVEMNTLQSARTETAINRLR